MQLSFLQSNKIYSPQNFRQKCSQLGICLFFTCFKKCFSVCHHIIFKSNKTTVYMANKIDLHIWQTVGYFTEYICDQNVKCSQFKSHVFICMERELKTFLVCCMLYVICYMFYVVATSMFVKSSHFCTMYTTVNNLTLSHVLTCAFQINILHKH